MTTTTGTGQTHTPTRRELEARTEAIEVSGWGTPFRFWQPRNACFWVYLGLVGSGIWHVWVQVSMLAPAFGDAYMASLVTSGAFAAVFVLFLHHMDRWERTPADLAVAAFFFGGLAATFAIAVPGNAAMMDLYAKLFGQGFATDWKAGLTAPFVEEFAKGAGFLLLMGLAPRTIRTVSDGLIVGAYLGLGFQVLEDVLYGANNALTNFGAHQVDSVVGSFAIRSLTGISSHALYCALFSAGLVYLVGTVAQPRRIGRGLALVLTPMLIHGVWDAASAIGRGGILAILIIVLTTVLSVVALVTAIRMAGGREREFMAAMLRPEVSNGTLTQDEFDAAVGHKQERKAAVSNRPDGVRRRAEKHVIVAARELGHDLAAFGGTDSAEVEHSRAEIARLRDRRRRQPKG